MLNQETIRKERAYYRKKKVRSIRNNTCISCGKDNDRNGVLYCSTCANKKKANQQKRLKALKDKIQERKNKATDNV